uniref:Uncharacterized protein n=1 Tax=Marmota marmota marmota TaxID=9994 RepID=A0A8C5ZRK0_MARMA
TLSSVRIYRFWGGYSMRHNIIQSPRWGSRPLRFTASACKRRTSPGPSSWCSRA